MLLSLDRSCQKEVKRIAFEAAIASEYSSPPSELIDINSIGMYSPGLFQSLVLMPSMIVLINVH